MSITLTSRKYVSLYRCRSHSHLSSVSLSIDVDHTHICESPENPSEALQIIGIHKVNPNTREFARHRPTAMNSFARESKELAVPSTPTLSLYVISGVMPFWSSQQRQARTNTSRHLPAHKRERVPSRSPLSLDIISGVRPCSFLSSTSTMNRPLRLASCVDTDVFSVSACLMPKTEAEYVPPFGLPREHGRL